MRKSLRFSSVHFIHQLYESCTSPIFQALKAGKLSPSDVVTFCDSKFSTKHPSFQHLSSDLYAFLMLFAIETIMRSWYYIDTPFSAERISPYVWERRGENKALGPIRKEHVYVPRPHH